MVNDLQFIYFPPKLNFICRELLLNEYATIAAALPRNCYTHAGGQGH